MTSEPGDSRGARGDRQPGRRGDRPDGGSGDRAPRSGEAPRRDGQARRRDGQAPRRDGQGPDQRSPRGQSDRRDRPDRPVRPPEPEIPEGVEPADLDRAARARLRTLSKANAERVAQHLVMAGRLLDEDAEAAYQHAQAAVRRAGRVDVVREAAALTAYATGRYAEALRELRTVRRLSGVDAHRAIEADCERGLGRPDRAIALVAEAPASLPPAERVELAIVASGARLDLDEPEAALSVLERAAVPGLDPDTEARLAEVTHDVLVVLGRAEAVEPEPADLRDGRSDASDEDVLEINDALEEG